MIQPIKKHLSTIIDAFTKQVPAYRTGDLLQMDFVPDTVNDLIANHWISLSAKQLPTVIKDATKPVFSICFVEK